MYRGHIHEYLLKYSWESLFTHCWFGGGVFAGTIRAPSHPLGDEVSHTDFYTLWVLGQ